MMNASQTAITKAKQSLLELDEKEAFHNRLQLCNQFMQQTDSLLVDEVIANGELEHDGAHISFKLPGHRKIWVAWKDINDKPYGIYFWVEGKRFDNFSRALLAADPTYTPSPSIMQRWLACFRKKVT